MRKFCLLWLLIIVSGQAAWGQNKAAGYWNGTMIRDDSVLNVSFEFKSNKNQLLGYFYAPSQKASGIPLDNVKNDGETLSFQLMSEPVTSFQLKLSGDNLNGQIIQEGFSNGIVSLMRSQLPTRNFSRINSTFKSGNHEIACRIYFPQTKGKHPAVVFMHGSGAEGMFANQYLAEYLAAKGIVALIQDKQGVGKSTGDWKTASFDDLANDYLNAVNLLKTFSSVNKSQIGIYGHSQGGTIAPLAASKSKDISFIIAAAAIGEPVFKQDLYRVENNLKSNGLLPEEIQSAMIYYKLWLEMARTGVGFENLDALNNLSKDKKWFELVQAPPKDHWIWKYYLQTGNYNGLDYWKTISVPVLLVYGENDQIEDVKTYITNIDKVLIEQGHNKNVTQIILPKAQHNLCIFPEKNEKFFWWYVSPGYPDMVASWILYKLKNE